MKGRFLRAIERIYDNTKNEVKTGHGITEKFKTTKGIRLGCLLSVLLFIIYLENLEENGR